MHETLRSPGFLIGLSDGSCLACLEVGTEPLNDRENLCMAHRYILWALDPVVTQTTHSLFKGLWPKRKADKNETRALKSALEHVVEKGLACRIPKQGYVRTAKGAKLLLLNAPPPGKRPRPVQTKPKTIQVGTRITFKVHQDTVCTVLPQPLRAYMPALFKCEDDGMLYVVQHECVEATDCDGTNPAHKHMLLRIVQA